MEARVAAHWVHTAVPALSNIGNDLLSIRGFSPSNIYAAGLTETPVIAHWNGSSWARMSLALPGAHTVRLVTVGGSTPADLWVAGNEPEGSQQAPVPVSFHLQSGIWRKEVLPRLPSGFSGSVDAIKALNATDAFALLDIINFSTASEKPFVARWNGARWTNVPVPAPNINDAGFDTRIGGLDATSGSDAWLVGFVPDLPAPLGFIEHFNGTSWRQVPLPAIPVQGSDGEELDGVYARTVNDAWAVGAVWIGSSPGAQMQRTLTLHWNGTRWAYVQSPSYGSISTINILNAVSGDGLSNDVWAVGTANDKLPLAMKWNGAAWSFPESPASFADGALDAVAVFAPQNVWAVGTDDDTEDRVPLADHYTP
ncbi:MAG: hypothetical protein JO322_10460 [Candidatus Eremiobacteraeota bacterium]|nr:hypothetical protein [Candidatus Eremiobacteraeota bacterium]